MKNYSLTLQNCYNENFPVVGDALKNGVFKLVDCTQYKWFPDLFDSEKMNLALLEEVVKASKVKESPGT